MAEKLGNGLQNRVDGSVTRRCLQICHWNPVTHGVLLVHGKIVFVKKTELAGCAILDDYGRILLLHRSTEETSQWELPGGKLETEEVAEQAAVREVAEELGVKVRLVASLGIGEFANDDAEYKYTWFQAVVESGDPKICEPETFDDLEFFEVEELLSLALSPNMQVFLEKIFSGEVSFIV